MMELLDRYLSLAVIVRKVETAVATVRHYHCVVHGDAELLVPCLLPVATDGLDHWRLLVRGGWTSCMTILLKVCPLEVLRRPCHHDLMKLRGRMCLRILTRTQNFVLKLILRNDMTVVVDARIV